ncbi:MAG: argininosuccinate lyase [Deltaproteobacteria bacterium]|jgi:argininosuccinate lyase|nr:argininosuccinate lyase [Deltaproteobacteria bacterium]
MAGSKDNGTRKGEGAPKGKAGESDPKPVKPKPAAPISAEARDTQRNPQKNPRKDAKKGEGGPPHLKGRISKPMHRALARASVSVRFDRKLAVHDVNGSLMHAAMLREASVLTKKEHRTIRKGLLSIRSRILKGGFRFDPALEDVHMNIERALIDMVGPVGAKLHTGRSRNEQVVVSELLYCRHEAKAIGKMLERLIRALLREARHSGEHFMPARAHMQPVQPSTIGHHLLAHSARFMRDLRRLKFFHLDYTVLPYGSGALSGTGFRLCPVPCELHLFNNHLCRLRPNSMETVASRDAPLVFMSILAILATGLSGLGEELVLWSSREYAYLSLSDDLTTTSSMMPQKKNPDGAELLRGKCGRTIGNLLSLLVTLKGLPLTYDRDLQEDKEPLFDSVETLRLALPLAAAMLGGITWDFGRLHGASDLPYSGASDIAWHLAGKGVGDEEAQAQARALAAWALSEGKALRDAGPEALARLCPKADPDFLGTLRPEAQFARREGLEYQDYGPELLDRVGKLESELKLHTLWLR